MLRLPSLIALWVVPMVLGNALVNDCTLITGNARHFARLDELRVENWLKD